MSETAEIDVAGGPAGGAQDFNLDDVEDKQQEGQQLYNAAQASLHDSGMDLGDGVVEMYQVPARPTEPEKEREMIQELESKANLEGFKLGDTWYVISARWWKAWKQYVQYDRFSSLHHSRPDPGRIDNEDIIEPGSEGKIRKTCMENYDFNVISKNMWDTLFAWYDGGPAMPRKVINTGYHSPNYVVEVRPLTLKVAKSSAAKTWVSVSVSKSATLGEFKKDMCEKFGLNPDDVQLWDYHGYSYYKLLENMKQKLELAQIIDGQAMYLEERDENGKFPEHIAKNSHSMSSNYYNSGGPTEPGTTGLINLGNTCFMNSSLQCLSHTAPLTEYFLNEVYKGDLNRDNPLGMKGELAEEYADLVKELWSGEHSAVAPRQFKWKLERFAPQFAGYQQHDSQELLAFLLDGLHEDLNKILKKPYVENPEVDGRPEEEVAREAWQVHKARNDSIIVDWFQGQLKSTLVCPKCNRVSITFDPFMYLSLPLPMKTTRVITVTLFYLDPKKKPIKLACEVKKEGTIKDLEKKVEEMIGSKRGSVVITDVYNSRFFKQFLPDESIDTIQDRDFICAYELLLSEDKDVEISYFPIIFRKEETHSYGSNYTRKTLFALPFVLSVPNSNKTTYKELYERIYTQIQRYLKLPEGKVIRTTDDLATSDGEAPPEETMGDGSHENLKAEEIESPNHMQHSSSDTSSEEEEDSPVTKKKRRSQPLFTIKCVDNYGMADRITLKDDDQFLELGDRQTLSINWTEDLADTYFDEDVVKDFDTHESCDRPEEKEIEEAITLDKCLEMFTIAEELGPDDPWYCSKCKEFQQASKKFDLWKVPPVLVIHLKRFSYKNRYWREKLETVVNYPIHNLDLTNYVKGPTDAPPIYDLYAVSNHFGSLGGGHYTAYGKNRLNNNWYKVDDSHVTKVDESRVQTSSAYVLFYRRKDTITPQAELQQQNHVDTPNTIPQEEDGVRAMDEESTQEIDRVDEGDQMEVMAE